MEISKGKLCLSKAVAIVTAVAVAFSLTVGAPAQASAAVTAVNAQASAASVSAQAIKAPTTKSYKNLLAKLTKRFSKGGKSAALNNNTAPAAIALNLVGKKSQIDTASVKSQIAANAPTSAGTMAKYVVIFQMAGATSAAKGHLAQMEALMSSSESVYSATWILMAYHMTGKKPSSKAAMTEKQLAAVIVATQDKKGAVSSAYGDDIQTTAEAVIALDGVSSAKAAQKKALAAVKAAQNADGGFYNSSNSAWNPGVSDVDTTGLAMLALYWYGKSQGNYAVAAPLPKAAKYLADKADSTLDGYSGLGGWDENMTSSSAFAGVAAMQAASKLTFKMSKATVGKIAKKKYTGKAIKPKPVVKYNGVKLKKGADYTLSYSKNKKVGTAKVKITGKGNFKGTKTVKFKIVKK